MTIENTYIVDRNLITVVGLLEEIKEALGSGDIPIASADTLGGVKVGSGLSITEQGVLSASGGGGGAFIIGAEDIEGITTLNKTWKEIKDAYLEGKQCIIEIGPTLRTSVISIDNFDESEQNEYFLYVVLFGGEIYKLSAEGENDYPTLPSD